MQYRDQTLYLEDVPLADIARREGTPSYVYSRAAILDRFQAYEQAFGDVPHQVCYAVKANGNLSILKLLAEAGAGFDIVSGGELFRVLKAGADPGTVIFSGVGKTSQEIDYALEQQIQSFNCESEPELALIDSLAARRGVQARVALRVNPDVDASTHPYISTGLRKHKFGIDIAEAEAVYERARALRESVARRRQLPHRLADHGHRADAGSLRQNDRAGGALARCAACPSARWIWAAVWAWRTNRAIKRRPFATISRPCASALPDTISKS